MTNAYRWGGCAVVIALALATHVGGLAHPLSIDDIPLLTIHPDVTDDAGLGRLWANDYWGPLRPGGQRNLYRPIAVLALHASVRVTGAAPAPERAANLVLLGVAAALVTAWTAAHAPLPLALLAGATVALHPSSAAHVQQIVGRADLLAWSGALAGALLARGAARAGRCGPARTLAVAVAATVALGAKESGFLVIPAVLGTIYLEGEPGRRLRPALRAGLALACVLAAALVGRTLALGAIVAPPSVYDVGPQANPLEPLGFAERASGALAVAQHYARLVVWPDTSFYHHPDTPPDWGASAAQGALLVVALAIATALGLARRAPYAVPAGIALASYAVVGNLVFRVGVYAANRLALPFVAAAAMGLALATAARWRAGPRARAAIALAWLTLGVGLGAETRASYPRWRSAVDVFAFDHAQRPDAYAPLALYAIALATEGHYAAAVPLLARAIELRPDHPQARIALSEALVHLRQRDRSRAELLRVLELRDPHPVVRYHQVLAHVNLAALAIAEGQHDAAESHLAQADAIEPGHARVLHNRASLCFARHDDRALVATLAELCRAWPRYEPGRTMRDEVVRLLRERGAEHLRGERWGAARTDLEYALTLDQDHAPTAFARAMACARSGDGAAAIAGFDHVLRLEPRHGPALANRGSAWLEAGDAVRALADFERAIALDPRLATPLARNVSRAREAVGGGGR